MSGDDRNARGLAASTPARVLKVAVLLGLLVFVPPLVDNPYVTTVFISALLFGLFGAVYDLMIGYAGLANFGYAGFIAAGAYGSALASFHYGISPWLGLLIGGACGALMGLLTGLITLRLRGLYLGLTTWFVAEALRSTISNTPGYTRGMQGLAVDPFPSILGIDFARGQLLNYYYLLIALGALIMLAMHLLVRSSRPRVPCHPRGSAGDREPRPERDQVQADQLHRGVLSDRRARRVLRPLPRHPVADARGVRGAAHGRDPDRVLCRRPQHPVGLAVRGLPAGRLSGMLP